jgi:DNA-directed RNA polymerase specialized sigma24 family protein
MTASINGHTHSAANHLNGTDCSRARFNDLKYLSPEQLARELGGDKARRTGNEWSTLCPAHNDRNPSLSIKTGDSGATVVICRTGCAQEAVIAAIAAKGFKLNDVVLAAAGPDATGNIGALLAKGWKIVACYDHRKADGDLSYQNVRLERTNGHRAKTFRQRRPDGRGGWIENLQGLARLPYLLPDLIASGEQDVHCCEGEKDALSVKALGLVSTSIANPNATDLSPLRGRRVFVHEDNDGAGRAKAAKLAEALHNQECSVRVVSFTDMPVGGDVTDWLATGRSLEDLLARCEDAPDWTPTRPELSEQGNLSAAEDSVEPTVLTPITLAGLLALELKPRVSVLDALLYVGGIMMMFAWRGIGKTWFALTLAYSIATGGTFLKWKAPQPRRVFYIDGEMPAIGLRERIEPIVAAFAEYPPEKGYFRFLPADLHENGLPNLATPEGQDAVEAVLGDAEVIIFDNVSTLFISGRENEAESWLPVQAWLLKLRRQGRSVVIVHHAGKGKAQRGTSRREDILDVVLNLRAPSDYEPNQGARFEVHFEKARGLNGKETDPFEASLELRDAKAVWTISDLEDARRTEILELKEDGLSVRAIARELGISKSAVQRALCKEKACA